jgi:hypothetical protein
MIPNVIDCRDAQSGAGEIARPSSGSRTVRSPSTASTAKASPSELIKTEGCGLLISAPLKRVVADVAFLIAQYAPEQHVSQEEETTLIA